MWDYSNVRLMVGCTFHFRADRLEHFYETIRAICHYPVGEVEIHVATNTFDPSQLASLKLLLDQLMETFPAALGYERRFSVHSFGGFRNPFELAWAHKSFIRDRFIGSSFSHFLYTEDDLEVTFANFLYYLRYRDLLKQDGLIPGFIRTEFNYDDNEIYSTDQFEPVKTFTRKHLELDGLSFMTLDNPHHAAFILDQELASEYVASRSFDMEKSSEVYGWELCERSTMALMWERLPEGFWVRAVVPVTKSLVIPSMACIRHLPNTYANKPESRLGKVKMSSVLVGN